jgi:hypothetical protein
MQANANPIIFPGFVTPEKIIFERYTDPNVNVDVAKNTAKICLRSEKEGLLIFLTGGGAGSMLGDIRLVRDFMAFEIMPNTGFLTSAPEAA